MEDSLGVVFFHSVAVQGHVLDPAALGKEQVRSRGQRVDVGSGRGSDGWRHLAVFHTYQRNKCSRSGTGAGGGPVRGDQRGRGDAAVCGVLTNGAAARLRAAPRDLLAVAVHAPAVARAAVALRGLVGAVLVTRGDVLANGGAGAPRPELRHGQQALPVSLAPSFRPLCWDGNEVIRQKPRFKDSDMTGPLFAYLGCRRSRRRSNPARTGR